MGTIVDSGTSQPFVFGRDHDELRDTVRRMARQRFADGYLARALTTVYPTDELRVLGDAGLTGLLVGSAHGGQDGDPSALGIACEEVAYADMAVAYALFGANLAAGAFSVASAAEAVVRKIDTAVAASGGARPAAADAVYAYLTADT